MWVWHAGIVPIILVENGMEIIPDGSARAAAK